MTIAVVLVPWLFAGAESWAGAFVCMLVLLGFFVWLFYQTLISRRPHIRMPLLTALLALLFLFLFMQQVPFPRNIVNRLNPLAEKTVRDGDALLARMGAEAFLPVPVGRNTNLATISFSAAAANSSMCVCLALIAVFLVFSNTVRRWRHVQRIAWVIVGFGFVMIVLSVLHKLSGAHDLLWVRMPRHGESIFGPFTNRNHFAFWANMLFALALGLNLSMHHSATGARPENWREQLALLSAKDVSRRLLLLFVMGVTGGAVCLTLSRGGMTSLLMALLCVIGFVCYRRRKDFSQGKLVMVGVFVAAGFVFWLGWFPALRRMESLVDVARNPLTDSRFLATRDTLAVWKGCPLTGCGIGGFRYVFPMFQGEELAFGRFIHAHNDWVQFLAETGVIGMGLFLCIIAAFCRLLIVRFRVADPRARRFVVGLLVGIVAAAFHSAIDYSLHKPANAFLLSALCGLCVAAVHVPRRITASSGNNDIHLEPQSLGVGSAVRRLLYCVVLICVMAAGVKTVLRLPGSLAFARFEYYYRLFYESPDGRDMALAIMSAENEARLVTRRQRDDTEMFRKMSSFYFRWALNRDLAPLTRLKLARDSVGMSVLAVYNTPSDSLAWVWLAHSYTLIGLWENAELCGKRALELGAAKESVRAFVGESKDQGGLSVHRFDLL